MGSVESFFKSLPSLSNPLKDVSLGKKGSNFFKGAVSGLTGPRERSVRTRGSFLGPSTSRMYSTSFAPRTGSGQLGELAGTIFSKFGRTGTRPIFSSSSKSSSFEEIKLKPKSNHVIPRSNEPSFIERMKQKLKPNKKLNKIGNSNISQTQPLEQPQQQTNPLEQPQQQIQEQPLQQTQSLEQAQQQIQGGSKKKPSENKKNPPKKETTPSKKEKKPSKKEKKSSENKKKSSENKKSSKK